MGVVNFCFWTEVVSVEVLLFIDCYVIYLLFIFILLADMILIFIFKSTDKLKHKNELTQ
jgi:hypothetical protein